jgi:hypothetical protein
MISLSITLNEEHMIAIDIGTVMLICLLVAVVLRRRTSVRLPRAVG